MKLEQIQRYLMNNEQLTQKLAESYPVRRAAQLTAYVFHRGKELGEDGVEKLRQSDVVNRVQQEAQQSGQRASKFTSTFKRELQEGFKDINDKIKKDR